MRVLYTIGINLYMIAIKIASIFGHSKCKLMCSGWKNSMTILTKKCQGTENKVWFHVSSLGEFEQARPVLESFKKRHENWIIVVTFFSPSGYEIRKNYKEADCICYLPMDTISNAKKVVQTIHPKIVYFVKYDFWYNYMREIKRIGAKMYIFSTIFRENQYFFKWYGKWYRKQLNTFDHLFIQNKETLQLLHKYNINQCTIAGDTRFDRVYDITKASKQFPEIENFIEDFPTIIAGSSWEPDEEHLYTFIKNYKGKLKLILAPHVITEEHIQKILKLYDEKNCIRYTQINQIQNIANKQILIIDTIGILSAMYRYATIAYIGGGFGQGIHNILEALTFGKPVIFGPNYHKFKEANDILNCQGGATYTKGNQLNNILCSWLNDKTRYTEASKKCLDYVNQNLGATKIILDKIA